MLGKFITFEGGEGSGKTTQIKKVSSYFQDRGIKTFITREPGGTDLGDKIRTLLLENSDIGELDLRTEVLLFSALRREHLSKKLEPALNAGYLVLCDRFIDSTTVYQGFGGGVSIRQIMMIHDLTLNTLDKFKPDLTFILDIDPIIGLKRSNRVGNKETKFEDIGIHFHNKVRNGFLQLAKKESRFSVINADQTIDAVFKDIIQSLNHKFKSE